MSIQDQFTLWLRKMGFHDDIPYDHLENICNKSTSGIFSQLISNVHPKDEVQTARNNIVINRLQNPEVLDEKRYAYPVKEIEVYNKKKQLDNRIKILQNNIEDDERKIDELIHENHLKYIIADRLKQEIDDCEEKSYLLMKKAEKLETDIHNVEELVVLTPVEDDENSNPEKITETLQSCVEKLTKLNVIGPAKLSNNSSMISSTIYSTLALKQFNHDNCFSTIKRSAVRTINEEGLEYFHEDEQNKENTVITNFYTSVKKSPKKRESFGLLPDHYIENVDESDFLMPPITDIRPQPAARSLFLEESSNIIDFECSLPSSSMLKDVENSTTIFEKLSENKDVSGILQELLHKNNRGTIFKTWLKLAENFHGKLKELFLDYSKIDSNCDDSFHIDKISLYGKHIKNELQIIKMKKLNEQLRQRIQSRKNILQSQLLENQSMEKVEEILHVIDLELEECVIDSHISFLQHEKNILMQSSSNTDNLEIFNKKIESVTKKIDLKSNSINEVISSIGRVFELVKNTREETTTYAARLNHITLDPYWIQPLTENNFQKEITIFQNFPLQYNRKCLVSGSRRLYSELCHNQIPLYIELNSSTLNNLALLLETPFNSTECMIYDKYRLKRKTLIYKNLLDKEKKDYSCDLGTKRTVQDLMVKQQFIINVIKELERLEFTLGEKIFVLCENNRKILNLWMETQFGDYLLPDREYDGHNFKYYWKKCIEYSEKM